MWRLLQVVISFLLLIILFPLLLIIVIVLLFRPPVFFRQERIGKGNKPFVLLKFRTMTPLKNNETLADPHGTARITPAGRFLRRFSLDELPQLWNILRGDMNLVGPRPLPVEYLERMDEGVRKRHRVRPGITGWAQVNGRNALTWEEKFSLDNWYVDNRSFRLDLKILAMTIPMVFQRKGINMDEEKTMEEFDS